MAHKTLLSSTLAVLICVAAIILGGYLVVDGILHPAIGQERHLNKRTSSDKNVDREIYFETERLKEEVKKPVVYKCEGTQCTNRPVHLELHTLPKKGEILEICC